VRSCDGVSRTRAGCRVGCWPDRARDSVLLCAEPRHDRYVFLPCPSLDRESVSLFCQRVAFCEGDVLVSHIPYVAYL
jgi:hypothetical protein